jgi:hypothetical protein
VVRGDRGDENVDSDVGNGWKHWGDSAEGRVKIDIIGLRSSRRYESAAVDGDAGVGSAREVGSHGQTIWNSSARTRRE